MKALNVAPLESVVAIKGGGTPSTERPEYWNGGIPWVSPKDMKSDEIGNSIDTISTIALDNSAASLLPTNAVLVVTRSGILARTVPIALATRELTVNQDIKALCANDSIDPRFLFYFMRSAEPTLLKLVTRGATVHRLSTDDIRSLPFPLVPMREQQRLVGLLDEAFEGIATARANAEKALVNARAVFANALDSAIQGKLDWEQKSSRESVVELLQQVQSARTAAITAGRAKAVKTTANETHNLPKLPGGWQWVQLETLTVGISDGVHQKPNYTKSGVPFIKVNNLTAGPGISFEDVSFVSREDHEEFIKRTRPERGDILISKDGTIGVVRLVETDVEFSLFVSVALVKPAIKELGPFLSYALSASSVQGQIVPQGAALKHLYLVDLRRLSIPLPPMTVQRRIVGRLDQLRQEVVRLEDLYMQKLAALDALKQSLLHEAFSGRL